MSSNAVDLPHAQACALQGLLLAGGYGAVSRLTDGTTGRPDGLVGQGTLAAIEEARVALGTGGEPGTVDANLVSALLTGPCT